MSQLALSGRLPKGRLGRLLSTKRGTIALGAAAALLAAVLLVVYLNRYRSSIEAGAQPTPVLVAKRLIPQGTPIAAIASQNLLQPADVPRDYVKQGAVSDPDLLRGQVAAEDIYPGQQVALADFTPAKNPVRAKVATDQRAVSVTLDGVKAMGGYVQSGDRVDIWVGVNAGVGGVSRKVVKLLLPNVYVVAAPAVGQTGSYYVLRVKGDDVGRLIYAADNAELRFVVRPVIGAKATPNKLYSEESLLFSGTRGGRS